MSLTNSTSGHKGNPPIDRSDSVGLLPNFIVIGAMKAGTTSLFRWLQSQPEVFTSPIKEPNFFSSERVWLKGIHWYESLFQGSCEWQLRGEASVSYTAPRLSECVSDRIASLIPDCRLIYVVRHPIDRARSHYRHQVQRGRERRPLNVALQNLASEYIQYSLYWSCLRPYTERFHREQICVVRLEDLIGGESDGWGIVLQHLGLDSRLPPTAAFNVTSEKAQFTALMRWLWEHRLLTHVDRYPRWMRKLGRQVLTRDGSQYRRRIKDASGNVSRKAQDLIQEEVIRLETWLGREQPLWPIDSYRR
jgi:nitrogen fixation protein